MSESAFRSEVDAREHGYATTRWSIVAAAGAGSGAEASAALEDLCRSYWYPVYADVRRRTVDVHAAQDLTQAFFCRLLEQRTIGRADPERGRFRTFLRATLKNFLANESERSRAAKRGGGNRTLSLDFDAGESRLSAEPSHDATAERLYERRWTLTLLEKTLEALQDEVRRDGRDRQFELLKDAIAGEGSAELFQVAAEALGISPAAAKQAAYRLRRRYRELFRAEVRQTVADDSEVDDEIAALLRALEG